jgi:predicted ATP-grasp superfamily ATP-dependent carboligase
MPASNLLIFGASTRAAAFSALRAGFTPWCADLFADADLEARCSVTRIPASAYPQSFVKLCRGDQSGPWMYTGGLENHPHLVQVMASARPLLGNNHGALDRARTPEAVAAIVSGAGLPGPAVFDEYPGEFPSEGRWLIKPKQGAGGAGIRFWDGRPRAPRGRRAVYLQEYIEGEACSAVYVGDGGQARWLGVTRQLVGEAKLHAAPFHYCGSIGPLKIPDTVRDSFERLGKALAAGCELRGLIGIDCVLADGVPYPVEVNPRYPASVEVLEYAAGVRALAMHCAAFDPSYQFPCPLGGEGLGERGARVVGKAILFARADLVFPAEGPWLETLRYPKDINEMPAFADIPHAGQSIDAGRPILTIFARAASVVECKTELWRAAAELERWLYSR